MMSLITLKAPWKKGPDTNGTYTDVHHLFLADIDYNFNLSNKPFDICDAGCAPNCQAPTVRLICR